MHLPWTRRRTQVHQSLPLVAVLLAGSLNTPAEDCRLGYARDLLRSASLPAAVDLKVERSLGPEEAFAISLGAGGGVLVAGGGPAGVLYGVQETLAARGAVRPMAEKPDFDLRGTVLFWMKDSSYDFELRPEEFPWFYDRALLTRYLDYLFESRFNAIFVWSGFVFPSLVELPEYPEARTLSETTSGWLELDATCGKWTGTRRQRWLIGQRGWRSDSARPRPGRCSAIGTSPPVRSCRVCRTSPA